MNTHNLRHNASPMYLMTLCISFLIFSQTVFAQIPYSLKNLSPQNRINQQVDNNDRVTLGKNRLKQLDNSEDKGVVDDNTQLESMRLVLKSSPEQSAALEAFTIAQQTLGNADYHHWLTPQEFASHFGVSNQDLSTIKAYLVKNGFSIDEVQAGGRSITFSGTAGQIKNTFHTEIHHYIWQGESHIANANDPQIPTALSAVVDGLVNIHDFHSRSRKSGVKPNSLPALVKPLNNNNSSSPTNPNYSSGGSNYLSPGDYSTIYNINPLYSAGFKGTGVTIAVLGKSNILTTDITNFQSFSGLPTKAPQVTVASRRQPGLVSGDQMESTLDLEWATGLAPNATIQFITAASTFNTDGIDTSATYAVNYNIGDIISLSYGTCESAMGSSQLSAWNSLWQQAQTQGQTVLVSSGDSGVAGCDTSTNSSASYGADVNGLCSSPYSTCVGGTQFNDTTNTSKYWSRSNTGTTDALGYIPEVAWNESGNVTGGSGLWASGGGTSTWTQPTWQVANGVPADGFRHVPDISLTAAQHDGYLISMSGTLYIAAGTSAAAPSMSGIIAILQQYNSGKRLGNINPNLYKLFQKQINGGSYAYFHPTPSGNNSVPGQTGYSANPNTYNQATGLGSVDANILVTQWLNANPATPTITITTPSTNSIAGQAITFNATVSGFMPTGTVQFYNNGVVIGTPTSLVNGVASLTTTALTSSGVDAITATYSGDSNNITSTSATLIETITAAPTQSQQVPTLKPWQEALLAMILLSLSIHMQKFQRQKASKTYLDQ